jgi:hypothetical protein
MSAKQHLGRAAVLQPPLNYLAFFFSAPRTCSIIRRIASERGGRSSCFAAHESIAARNSGESLIAVTGSRPVAGRPLFFGTTPIDFAIFRYYHNIRTKKEEIGRHENARRDLRDRRLQDGQGRIGEAQRDLVCISGSQAKIKRGGCATDARISDVYRASRPASRASVGSTHSALTRTKDLTHGTS